MSLLAIADRKIPRRNFVLSRHLNKLRWLVLSVVIAILILLLGWVNHFNLFTANTIDQSLSLSIRKIVGANRMNIFIQLLMSKY